MSDPERLLSPDSDSTALERELLSRVRDVGPLGDAKERAWRGIAAGIAGVGVIGTGASTAAATSKLGAATASSLGLLKLALGVAAATAVASAGYVLSRDAAPEAGRLATSPRPTVARPAAPVVAEPAPAAPSAHPEPPVVAPATRPALKRPAASAAEMLAAESATLTHARAQLRGGDAQGAQATLERLQRDFPTGVLQQEREVLAIEVLAKRGAAAAARQRAERFIAAHPGSPHNDALRRFLRD